jgi:hypothetical protein
VDLTRPNTTITSNPTDPSDSPFGGFTFTSNETGSTFQCSIDAGAYVSCPASYTTPFLTDGEHTLLVRAQDPAGNLDDTPATYTWEVHALGDGGVGDGGVAEAGVEAGPVDTAPDTTLIFQDANSDVKLDTPPVILDALPDLAQPADRSADITPDLSIIIVADAAKDAPDAGPVVVSDAGEAGAQDATDKKDIQLQDATPVDTTVRIEPDTAPYTQTPDAAKPTPDAPVIITPAPTGLKLMGSGFCSINPQHDSAPGLFTLFLVGAFGLMILRRRRR